MKRTLLLGKHPLFYKVGQLDIVAEEVTPMSENGYYAGGSTPTSNVLPPVTTDPVIKYETDVVPVPYAEPITNTNTNTSDTPTADASQGTTPTNTTDSVTSDTPLSPVTTPTTTPDGTGTSTKLSSNWWWVLAATALIYKLSKD
jgi:hypothetical protein